MQEFEEVTPPGWENVVQALKDKGDVDNPWAVAWGMKNRGIEPKKENGDPYDPHALYRRYQHECRQAEAMSMSSMGQLARKGGEWREGFRKAVESMRPARLSGVGWVTPFREAVASPAGQAVGVPRVVLISAGPGNLADRNFYAPDIIERDCRIFEGKPCHLNHEGTYDSANRPEREVEGIGGYFRNVEPKMVDGNVAAVGDLIYLTDLSGNLTETGRRMREMVEAAIRYKQEMPDSDGQLMGFSINASGGSESISSEKLITRYPQFRHQLQEADEWNAVTGIDQATSADLVTLPARGGRVLGIHRQQESRRWRIDFEQVMESINWRKQLKQMAESAELL